MSAEQIAAALASPSDLITQSVVGAANAFTAALCRLTQGQPASVCGSAAFVSCQDKLHG